MAKAVSTDKARRVASKPKSGAGPSLLCKSKTGAKEYLIVPGPKSDQFTLWEKEKKGYVEVAVADSPNDLEEFVDWDA